MANTEQGKGTDPAPPAPGPVLVTRRDLAALVGVHPITICKWEREGMPVATRGGRGRPSFYDEAVVRAWRQRRDELAAAEKSVSLEEARIRKELSQAALNEQRHSMTARKLLPVEEV